MTTKNEESKDSPYSILLLGGPGVGKSTLANYIIDGKNSGKFKSSKQASTGVTKNVQSYTSNMFGQSREINDPETKVVKVFDTPGLSSTDMPIEDWARILRKTIGTQQKLDIVLIVTKMTDYRIDEKIVMTIEATNFFLEKLEYKNIFVVFTHCDHFDVDSQEEEEEQKTNKGSKQDTSKKTKDEQMKITAVERLEMYNKTLKTKLLLDNVIFFDKKLASLKPLEAKLIRGEANIVDNVIKKVEPYEEKVKNVYINYNMMQDCSQKISNQLQWVPYNYENDTQDLSTISSNSQMQPYEQDYLELKQKRRYYRPSMNDGKTKEGYPDLRMKQNKGLRDSVASQYFLDQSKNSSHWKPSEHGGLTKKGELDKRMKQSAFNKPEPNQIGFNKSDNFFSNIFQSKKQTNNLCDFSYSTTNNNVSSYCGPTKKDGTLDMRYKVNKDYVNSGSLGKNGCSNYTNIGSSGNGRVGSYDGGYGGNSSCNYGRTSSTGYGNSGINISSGPLTKNGLPDMRYKANRK